MHVFVTGGSGFIGGHVIEGLVARGHTVSAMARSARSADTVRGFGATAVPCELGAVPASALAGVDAIVHCAAFVEEWGTRAQFFAANVDGTVQLLDAAREAGVRRFVHIGTEAALFDGHELVDLDESHPYPARQRFLYSESKAEAERRVCAANDEARLTTIVLRPRFVWGPRDTSVLPAILRMARSGRWTWLDGGHHQTSTTYVENLVHAVALALEHGRGGEVYFVADAERSSLRDFLTRLAATEDVPLRGRSIPGWLARPLASTLETTWRLLRRRDTPPMTRFAVSMMSRTVTVRTDKARAELGYEPPVTLEEGLERTRRAAV